MASFQILLATTTRSNFHINRQLWHPSSADNFRCFGNSEDDRFLSHPQLSLVEGLENCVTRPAFGRRLRRHLACNKLGVHILVQRCASASYGRMALRHTSLLPTRICYRLVAVSGDSHHCYKMCLGLLPHRPPYLVYKEALNLLSCVEERYYCYKVI
jgi:hypothetical protein